MRKMPELYSFTQVEQMLSHKIDGDEIFTKEELLRDFLELTPKAVVDYMVEAQKVVLSLAAYIEHLKDGEA